jgi:hypothetical protein
VSGPETTFIQSVHRHLPNELYRMKNHNQYNGGIPDVWYSGPAGDLWVEYKFITVPARDTTVINFGLSELQQSWLKARHHEGRKVGVIVGSKLGGVWYSGLTWDTTITASSFRAQLTARSELATTITNITS